MIVQSLTPETIPVFLKEYQVKDTTDLQAALYEHLESEYNYVKELQTSTGSEVVLQDFLLSGTDFGSVYFQNETSVSS